MRLYIQHFIKKGVLMTDTLKPEVGGQRPEDRGRELEPYVPEGTLLGLEPYHTKEFALVLTVHRDDLAEAGLPKGLAEKVSDDTLMKIGEELGEALVESGFWDCLRSLISSCGFGEDDMVERLLEDGWVEYKYCSRGFGMPDIQMRYLFHPDVGFDAEVWKDKPFCHSALDYKGVRPVTCHFDVWLAGIDKKLYVKTGTSHDGEEDDDV